MASTNSPATIWSVGDSVGSDNAGNTSAIPSSPALLVVSTATDSPTEEPTGTPYYLAVDDFYMWDGSVWVGPYSVAT